MVINKLNASFGKLNGESLELEPGLNVICSPNESGKSTWCAFIRAMLYGVDSSERAKVGYLPDKQRYAPWSGALMEGSMELEHLGKSITLSRTTRLKAAPMREFSAVYTGTNTAVEGLTGQNAGEALTGASKELFRRSSFIEQGSVAVSGSPELEKRIAAIVSTGDEGCSYSEADERLRAWQRKRRFNKRGLLPELENKMDGNKRRIGELESAVSEKARLERDIAGGKAECARLEGAVAESRKQARKDALALLQTTHAERSAAEKARGEASEKLRGCELALDGCVLGSVTPDEAAALCSADKNAALEAKAESEKKNSTAPAVILFILAAILAALGAFVKTFLLIPAAAALVIACLLFVRYKKAAARILEARKRRRELLAKYEASYEADIELRAAEHRELYNKREAAAEALRAAEAQLLDAQRRQSEAEAETLSGLDFASGSSEAARLGRSLTAAQENVARLERAFSELSGRLKVMGDPVVLASELGAMQEEYALVQGEYDAIALAIDTLRAADADIQSRFSPELGRTAANYMSLMTGGRYTSVSVNRDFSVRTGMEGDSVAREAEYLSAGALDLMYFALRLAICRLALPDAQAPLILDDTLVNLDPERTAQAMSLLHEIAKERQVIVFTCKPIE